MNIEKIVNKNIKNMRESSNRQEIFIFG